MAPGENNRIRRPLAENRGIPMHHQWTARRGTDGAGQRQMRMKLLTGHPRREWLAGGLEPLRQFRQSLQIAPDARPHDPRLSFIRERTAAGDKQVEQGSGAANVPHRGDERRGRLVRHVAEKGEGEMKPSSGHNPESRPEIARPFPRPREQCSVEDLLHKQGQEKALTRREGHPRLSETRISMAGGSGLSASSRSRSFTGR